MSLLFKKLNIFFLEQKMIISVTIFECEIFLVLQNIIILTAISTGGISLNFWLLATIHFFPFLFKIFLIIISIHFYVHHCYFVRFHFLVSFNLLLPFFFMCFFFYIKKGVLYIWIHTYISMENVFIFFFRKIQDLNGYFYVASAAVVVVMWQLLLYRDICMYVECVFK